MYRRQVLAVSGVLLAAGCTDGSADGQFTADAATYLVGADDLGEGWEQDRTYDPLYSADTDSQRAVDFVRDGDLLTVAVGIFPTPDGASAFLDDRRSSYAEQDLEVSSVDVGDEAIEGSDGTIATVDARRSNAFFEAYGDPDLSVVRRVARRQNEQFE